MTVVVPRAVRAVGDGGPGPRRDLVTTLPMPGNDLAETLLRLDCCRGWRALPRRPQPCAVGARPPGSLPVWMSPDLRDHGVRPR